MRILQKENPRQKTVVVLEEVEEEKADAEAECEAANSDVAKFSTSFPVFFLVLGARVVRVRLELPLVVVGHQLVDRELTLVPA